MRKGIIILSIVIIGIIGLMYGVPFIQDFTTQLTNTYSDGWYEYTLRYPKDGSIYQMGYFNKSTSDFDQKLVPSEVDIRIIGKGKVENVSLPPFSQTCLVRHSVADDPVLGIAGDSSVVFNNLTWNKQKVNPNYSNWKAYSGIMWQTNGGGLLYRVETSADFKEELLCEKIVSSFENKIDPSIPEAVEAGDAKKAAMAYASKNYPNKVFVAGSFYEDQLANNVIHRTLVPTNTAVVAVSDIVSWDSFFRPDANPTAIKVLKQNGTWTAVGIIEPARKVLR